MARCNASLKNSSGKFIHGAVEVSEYTSNQNTYDFEVDPNLYIGDFSYGEKCELCIDPYYDIGDTPSTLKNVKIIKWSGGHSMKNPPIIELEVI